MKTLKEILNEAILKAPKFPKLKNLSPEEEKQAEKAFNQWSAYNNQFRHIINILTDRSGKWYVGSTKNELENKLKNLSAQNLSKFRSDVAALLKLSKEADKSMNKVRDEANKLIKTLE